MDRDRMIRIGHLSTVYHTSFLLRSTPTLSDQGIDARWTLYPSGPDVIAAMHEGAVDVGYIGLPPAMIGIDRGLSIRCIAGGHIEGTLLIAGKGVQSLSEYAGTGEFLEQFAGGVIGTPPRGSIHDVIVRDLLDRYENIAISVRNYPWADFLPDAIERGEIAAAARLYTGAKIVIPPDRLWPFNPSYGILVRQEMLGRDDLLKRFLLSHEAACEMIRSDPAACARIVAKEVRMVDAAFVLEAYRISPKYCAALPLEYIGSTMKFMRALHRLGYTSRLLEDEEIFEPSIIREVHPAPYHYDDGIHAGAEARVGSAP
ncbi:MAG: ABC transporter substrate-binding protein [Methanomicrobiales archaeon]|nr:ABC transporter substrate-binding protein [Methanomicrobiales archaeon]